MSKNVKIGNKIFNNVEYISCKRADVDGVQCLFIDNDDKSKPIEISTTEEMDALLVVSNIGKIYKFVGTTDEKYINGDLYLVEETK